MKATITALIFFMMPSVGFAGSYASTGPFYSSYGLPLEKGGGCISGSIGDAVPGNSAASMQLAAVDTSGKLRDAGFIGYADRISQFPSNAHDNRIDFLPGLSTFTVCLKPGRYSIRGISISFIDFRNRINIPFDIVEGKNAYIGSFVFYGLVPNPDCEMTDKKLFVGFRDEFSRDIEHIDTSKNKLAIPLEKRLIDPKAGAPYFVSCSN